jgi:hypothetical protein
VFGYEIYDRYAMDAVRLSSPFPPVPSDLMAVAAPAAAGIRIVTGFKYALHGPPVAPRERC